VLEVLNVGDLDSQIRHVQVDNEVECNNGHGSTF
jgi:hypothetical protein